ncbi:MAG: UPF0158 family protein [Acidobacteriota bacterium]
MAGPRIDADELTMALENHSYDMQFFLDRQTGEVFPLFEDNEESDENRERIEADPDRFVAVEPLPSSVGWEVMAAFVESLPDGAARRHLAAALSARHPFRAFKDALSGHPTLREEWFAFHDEAWARLAAEWLEDEGIDAALSSRRGLPTGGDARR